MQHMLRSETSISQDISAGADRIARFGRGSLLDVFPQAAGRLQTDERDALLDQTRLRLRSFAPGPVEAYDWPAYGVSLVNGFMLRETPAGSRAFVQLFGPGELIEGPLANTPTFGTRSWIHVLIPATVAELPHELEPVLHRWPVIYDEIHAELRAQRARIETQAAISHFPAVALRIVAILHHLAGAHGRATHTGTVVEAPLTGDLLSRLVGADPAAVDLALEELSAQGAVQREEGGRFVLPPAATAYLAEGMAADAARLY
jgi:CRP-like cAMP-binding protein